MLKWHHCHDCGRHVAWLCDRCNLTLSEHAIEHWDAIAQVHEHACDPRMFHVPMSGRAPEVARHGTRTQHLSNGGGDDRYVSVSTLDGFITVEQLAVICGVNANTARDIASGRSTGQPIGRRMGKGGWFISHHNVMSYLEQRWDLKP
jgi:hypothetical protein